MNRNFAYNKDYVEGNLLVVTRCPLCGTLQTLTIKRGKEDEDSRLIYNYFHGDKCIQDIFTDAKCAEVYEEDPEIVREFFISGICPKCFHSMNWLEENLGEFPDDEPEEDVVITSQDLKEYMYN